MRHAIVLSPEAVADLRGLKANVRSQVRDAIELYLRHQPKKARKSRIKRLRGLTRPQYRLRVKDVRVYYDVVDETVQVLAIISKADSNTWLEEKGVPDEGSSTV